jgi:3-oxoacyl-[acyl-carrier-protein] synthase-3
VETVGIVGTGNYLPHEPITFESYLEAGMVVDPMSRSPLLRAPATRHHVAAGDRASEMIQRAAGPMFERLGVDPSTDVDLLITNVLLPDDLFTGCGAETAHRMGISTDWIIDLHNGGCASFPYMLRLAQAIISAGGARTALLANVQNTAGQVFHQEENRFKSHSVSAGDGCGVAYLAAGRGSPILGVQTRNTPETAGDLGPATPDGRLYWEAGASTLDVQFDPAKTRETLALGNRLIPELVGELCERSDFDVQDIDVLITNQPNRMFLRNWRDALGIPPERHLDTYDRYGNLYGAGVSVTLHDAAMSGLLHDGDLVVFAGFAHAGDFAAAAAVRWVSQEG